MMNTDLFTFIECIQTALIAVHAIASLGMFWALILLVRLLRETRQQAATQSLLAVHALSPEQRQGLGSILDNSHETDLRELLNALDHLEEIEQKR